jgi:hypothetical protein
MKKSNRNVVYAVTSTRTYKSEDPSPGKETWEQTDTLYVLASNAEDAIARVRQHWDRDDKYDGFIKRRTLFLIDEVRQGNVLDIW